MRGGPEERGQRQDATVFGLDEERLATWLGWFSVGLGLAQVTVPSEVNRLIGVSDTDRSRQVMRGIGMRELAAGFGILTQPRPAGWLWARVAGDVMDLALLGRELAADRSRKERIAAATAAVAGVTLLDVLCGRRLSRKELPRHDDGQASWTGMVTGDRRIHTTKVITIGKPAEELYRCWRDFTNLQRFMRHLEEVRVIDDRRSHWKAQAPLGRTVEWDAEITDDQPNRRIAWRSAPGADVENSGSVSFERAPGGRGTVVRVEMEYDPPGGIIGATFAKLFGRDAGQQVQESLRSFKQLMETGEIVQSDATAKGWGAGQPPG